MGTNKVVTLYHAYCQYRVYIYFIVYIYTFVWVCWWSCLCLRGLCQLVVALLLLYLCDVIITFMIVFLYTVIVQSDVRLSFLSLQLAALFLEVWNKSQGWQDSPQGGSGDWHYDICHISIWHIMAYAISSWLCVW